jgi:hypothetical protein
MFGKCHAGKKDGKDGKDERMKRERWEGKIF